MLGSERCIGALCQVVSGASLSLQKGRVEVLRRHLSLGGPTQMSQQYYQRDPQRWEEPDSFRPDRMLQPGATSSPAWTPFGEVVLTTSCAQNTSPPKLP